MEVFVSVNVLQFFFSDDLPKYYNELNKLNNELINGYNIRLANYQEGMETMKTINSILQKASRLRGLFANYLIFFFAKQIFL